MKADKDRIQQLADDISETLGEAESMARKTDAAASETRRAIRRLHKLLKEETDGGVVIQATGEPK